MRIVQLSDIHLSKYNLEDLKNYYLRALIEDLKKFSEEKPIDVILFTGDLVDKGGESLGMKPYHVFQDKVIKPITEALNLTTDQVLLLPGNHDVNRHEIGEFVEAGLCSKLDSSKANEILLETNTEFTDVNRRIEKFKSFESEFHENNSNYVYSNNESTSVLEENGNKVGFALINDSWRCSASLTQEQHFIGYNQLFKTEQLFSKEGAVLNIAAFHHPLNAINQDESDEVENILKSKSFDIAFFGHSHKHEAKALASATGGYLTINGRAAFNQPEEKIAKFQPGYNILDVDPGERCYTLFARLFIRDNGYRFDSDTAALPGGQESSMLPNRPSYVELAEAEDSNNRDKELPNSYSADVHRIVHLLIGKSLYPNPYSFVRELIQNSVDACNRLRKKQTHLTPQIIINIDSQENYLEVKDEGDGMTKSIVKNHFSVIGKSISQEFNDSTGNFNLISQFGIGFMSTFIVAEKVVVSTKNNEDEQIIFEITDVFKEFNYLNQPSETSTSKSGTSIRVYLKKDFDLNIALQHIIHYCRHIENLKITYDGHQQPINESWNIEGAPYNFPLQTERYQSQLCIDVNPRNLIASNSGFLIESNPGPLLPFKFPFIIGGEVNFFPKGIDFDMSRTKIMESEKSISFQREISVSLRKLFRDALETGEPNLVQSVVQYLHFYLQNYDNNNSQIQLTHTNFYSKKELITLCSNYTTLDYQGRIWSISEIVTSLKSRSLDQIFYISSQIADDYEMILVQYLQNKGYLIVKDRSYNVAFRDGPSTISFLNIIQPIAATHGMSVIELKQVQDDVTKDMKMDKSQLHESIQKNISQIESMH
ncbi:MAG: metallophosphoesterase, partial [Tunicatimonas sp.]